MGDTTALSDQVEADLHNAGIGTVDRVAGPDRFATAAAAADRLDRLRDTPAAHAYLTLGAHPDPRRDWPDAVAVSALAAYRHDPILLTGPDRLPDATRQALADLYIGSVTIIGGIAAVSPDVQRQLEQAGISVNRIAGDSRYTTSVAVADASLSAGMRADATWVATGRNWPDSLTAGPAAAHRGNILLLADGQTAQTDSTSIRWIAAHAPDIGQLPLVGAPDVLTAPVAAAIDQTASQ